MQQIVENLKTNDYYSGSYNDMVSDNASSVSKFYNELGLLRKFVDEKFNIVKDKAYLKLKGYEEKLLKDTGRTIINDGSGTCTYPTSCCQRQWHCDQPFR